MYKQSPLISLIIPIYNESKTISGTLEHLQQWGNRLEIIVVDGGSKDGTPDLAGTASVVVQALKGRAVQMNAGASHARGEWLVFLHSDTRLPPDFLRQMELALQNKQVVGGAFKMRINHPGLFFYLTSLGSNLRAATTGIYFGDQTIFARRDVFHRVGGFPPLELMEDWDFSRRLRRAGKTVLLPGPVSTSARRWLVNGKWRTTWLLHKIKLLYLLGTDPAELKKIYTDTR
ncbi:MAG: TIGR04283 family arsenosugar biosynthesis glycosyltransferase [Desulfotomaculaceae bacterium]